MNGLWADSFKEGVLSRVAHDVRIRLPDPQLQRDGDTLTVTCELTGLVVEGALENGAVNAKRLSAKDKRDILENLRSKVLHTKRHPRAVFTGPLVQEGLTLRCEGRLSLHGLSRPLTVQGHLDGQTLRGEVMLVPSQWGIAPFKALLGAIKLQDRVRVHFAVNLPA